MSKSRIVPVLLLLLLAACGTPEIARERDRGPMLPAEIEEALRSDDPARRADAAEQVEAMEPGARRAALLEALGTDDRPDVRLLAARILGERHLRDPGVLEALGRALASDPDPDVRIVIAGSVSVSGKILGLDLLVTALGNDPSLLVRQRIAAALDRMTGETFGAVLVGRVDEASLAADTAAMDYDGWFADHETRLTWDPAAGRFVPREPAR